jgi:hypothetical protein
MRRTLFLILLGAAILGAQKFATRKVSDEFIGAWKLVSYERRTAAGELTYPMGPNPVGRLAYDPMGRMSAQLMRPDRPNFHAAVAIEGSPEEKIAAFGGYIAYYGTYSVNPADRTVVHHVEASLFPNWIGSDLRRSYEFSGSQLILHAKGQGTDNKLVWERAR